MKIGGDLERGRKQSTISIFLFNILKVKLKMIRLDILIEIEIKLSFWHFEFNNIMNNFKSNKMI